MSPVFDNPEAKRKCQIFTPEEIVKCMLDYIDYDRNIYGKTILENACGDGRFLKEIVKRYIVDCKQNGLTVSQIRVGLMRDIWGAEIDLLHFNNCINSLNKIVASYGIRNVKWNIFNKDSLRNPFHLSFDFVVSNPPYLSYWNIPEKEREFIRNKYTSCRNGACDYCFAFIEESILRLNDTGKLAYIIPSSIFKTRAGKTIRELINPLVTSIYDYKNNKVFDDALTSPAIIILNKSYFSTVFNYHNLMDHKFYTISKNSLEDIWVFNAQELKKSPTQRRFGDYFKVSTSIATQYNKAFLIIDWKSKGKYLVNGTGEKVEKAAVKKAASPKSMLTNHSEYIIFPYYFISGKRKHYLVNQYRKIYPMTYKYLYKFKDKLEGRAADKNASWYEYGRTQALDHISQPKLLISSIVTKKVKIFKLDEATIPYSGIFITTTSNMSLDTGVEILQSKAFFEYVSSIGINVNGNSIRITAKNISDFYLDA